jgi:hypothetical protein
MHGLVLIVSEPMRRGHWTGQDTRSRFPRNINFNLARASTFLIAGWIVAVFDGDRAPFSR